MCDLEAIGAPSIFRLIRKGAAFARMFPTLDLSCEENAGGESLIAQAELLKPQESGQFPDEPAKTKGAKVHR